MPLTTETGVTLKYPYALWAKITKENRINNDEVMDAFIAMEKIYKTAIDMNVLISQLKAENLRLKQENEFMLRIINANDAT